MLSNFYCFNCDSKLTLRHGKLARFKNNYGSFVGLECPLCGGYAKKVGVPSGIATHVDSAPVAIMQDDKGRQIAVDKKGNETKNVYEHDPRGYRRAGKKTREYDQHGKHYSQW